MSWAGSDLDKDGRWEVVKAQVGEERLGYRSLRGGDIGPKFSGFDGDACDGEQRQRILVWVLCL